MEDEITKAIVWWEQEYLKSNKFAYGHQHKNRWTDFYLCAGAGTL